MKCCENAQSPTTVLEVRGMTCNHCKMSIEKALKENSQVSSVSVDVEQGKVCIQHEADVDLCCIKEAITKLGYEVE